MPYSDMEKTILDITYRRFKKNHESEYALSALIEYENLLDRKRLTKYLEQYPRRMAEMVRVRL